MSDEPIECRSPEGIAEGLVDSAITIIWALTHGVNGQSYDLTPDNVKGALQDLFESPELAELRAAAYAD